MSKDVYVLAPDQIAFDLKPRVDGLLSMIGHDSTGISVEFDLHQKVPVAKRLIIHAREKTNKHPKLEFPAQTVANHLDDGPVVIHGPSLDIKGQTLMADLPSKARNVLHGLGREFDQIVITNIPKPQEEGETTDAQ